MGYNTQQARNAYPELVVGGVDSKWNVLGDAPHCDWTATDFAEFIGGPPDYTEDTRVRLRFHAETAEAARACSQVMEFHGYRFRETAGGGTSCRKITDGVKTSPHAHGICFDINPSKNKYLRSFLGLIQWGLQTDMPMEMIEDLEAIRTLGGHPVVSWGGRWTNKKDPMHFEFVKCKRVELGEGIDWTTVRGAAAEEEDMWSRRLDENGWRQLASAGIAAGGVEAVVDYWWTNAALRTDAEHREASASMLAALAVRVASRFNDPPPMM